ncbi:MAG: hypothetical protein KBD64_00220 [Gammaproteobacteria bacterium]|nr:hypothetical protein [Gammaproteobacteria bacterium]
MVDKKNDPFDPSYDFLDDDLNPSTSNSHSSSNSSSNRDQNFGDLDSFDLSHEDQSSIDDELLNNNNDSFQPVPKTSGVMEVVKTYGIVILVFLVIGYFGFKYSLNSILGNKPATNTTATAGTTKNSTVKPSTPNATAITAQTIPLHGQTTANTTFEPLNNVPPGIPVNPVNPVNPVTTNSPVLAPVNTNVLTPAPALDGIKTDLENVKQMIGGMSNQLKVSLGQDEKNISDLKQQIEQLAIYVQGIGKSMGALSADAQKQQKILEGLIAGVPYPKANAKKDDKTYIIDALISGRAWIKTAGPNGKNFTVGVGDTLPGVGKIVDIDQTSNTITTDTGTVLKQ